ncbi:MAG: hypothetical protein ACI8RZ_005545 [Myxococcota bacterium]|jgi:hypothetical protein
MAPTSNAPIFIIGTERSGSNLLRLILNAHSRIAIPHPPHIMKYLAHLEDHYGDLTDDRNMRALVADILTLIEAHIFPWDYNLDADTLVSEVTERSTFGAVAAIYEHVREAEGKARWGNKSTFMVHYTGQVRSVYPDARFILLVRDPRDVAVSARKSVFSPCHPVLSAQLWAEQQVVGLTLLDSLPAEAIHMLRYEDLLSNPDGAVQAVCDFLGEEFEPGMLQFFKGREAKKSAGLSESWGNTGKPVLKNNAGKFRKELSAEDILAVEAVCRTPMRAMGYAPTNPEEALSSWRLSLTDRVGIRVSEAVMRTRIELRSLQRDDNHWRRWQRDATARALSIRRR